MGISRVLLLVAISLITLLTGCIKTAVQQGNVLSESRVAAVAVGDTRFHVESLLGSPVIKMPLHSNWAVYVESYEDVATGKLNSRHITIVYNQSLRVQSIDRSALGRALPHQ
ncbi:MAG: outer membrane protein assembly factor BamE [Mariprofundales bacterium]|nr:outer membrane protein assembly factor BamE [Mariprofundales bacterium]